uniref:Uncharacterized protein n=1 Tax=Arcella intermedia TaxID=1963864 RepID=A0A6B2KYD8_9EUKA
MQSRISGEDIYNKQQETLIVWNEIDQGDDDDEGTDLALSFQDKEGCSEIWDEICEIQQSLRSPSYIDLEALLKMRDDPDEYSTKTVTLPPANLSNIDEIQRLLSDAITVGQKQSTASLILKDQYLPKLLDLWKVVDDLSSTEDYAKMYHIFKDLIMLNCVPLIEIIVSSKYIIDVMAALEHDPERHIGTIKHSDFLKSQAQFKEVVPLNDPQLVNKIHQTFRLQYLKDVALARILDEPTFASINSLIFVNNIHIITDLAGNEAVMNQIFTKLKAPSTTPEELKDILAYLLEMCSLAKNLEPKNKTVFYELLSRNGLFGVIENTFTSKDVKVRMTCAELLLNTVEHDPHLLRSHIIKQDNSLFDVILNSLSTCPDQETGVINILTDVVRNICDVTGLLEGSEKTQFLNTFYQHHAKTLFAPLTQEIPTNMYHSEAAGLLKNNLCELLSSFVKNHPQCISNFLLKNNFVKSLLNLLNCREKWLVLSALRFFRGFIDVENTAFREYIISENLFEPIVEVFLRNASKYNLLDSAILDLFECILKKNMKPIIKHFVEKHYEKVKHITYSPVFHKLKEQSEKNEFMPPTPETSDAVLESLRTRERNRFLENRNEEAWFDEEDDEDYLPEKDLSSKKSGGTLKNTDHSIDQFTSHEEFISKKRRDEDDDIPFTSLEEFNKQKKRGRDDEVNILGELKESPTKRGKKFGGPNGKEKIKEKT